MASQATQEQLQAGRDYEALMVPALFAPWTQHLVNGAAVVDGSHVLDVACGSGVLARAAYERCGTSGRVVGVDLSPGMIAAAREIEPDIEWVTAAAEDLPFERDTFQCVVSQFGMMFFQDTQKAATEMHRVVRPGGNLAVAVWHCIDRNPVYGEIVSALDEIVSPEAASAVAVPFSLGDSNAVAGLFSVAGFGEISCETKSELAEFSDTRTIAEVELRGWLPVFNIHLDEETIAEVLGVLDARLSRYMQSPRTGVFETSAYIVTAQKPI